MSEMILPGTYIEVRPEGLIAPGQITVGNIGIVGTASKGPPNQPMLLSTYTDAQNSFGAYDSYYDPTVNYDPNNPTYSPNSLTLVRAVQLAYQHGANLVWAVRVAKNAAKASANVTSPTDNCAVLTATTEGTWANSLGFSVAAATGPVNVVQQKAFTAGEAAARKITLDHPPLASTRTRVTVAVSPTKTLTPTVVFDTAAGAGQVEIVTQGGSAGEVDFGDAVQAGWIYNVSYYVDASKGTTVTLQLGRRTETYNVVDGNTLVSAINDPQTGSAWVTALNGAHPNELPNTTSGPPAAFTGGTNGETADEGTYQAGLDALLDVDAHIILAAGQSNDVMGAALDAHCQQASTDEYKRDRIAVVGSAQEDLKKPDEYFDKLIGNTLNSDRVVFVAPGIQTSSSAPEEPAPSVILSGAYSAAVIAGMLAALPPHISLTNKTVSVDDLEVHFNNAQLTELVQNRVTALELHRGFHVLRGQTTDDGAFREITTRRIVDYAKYGVRSSADPYIGLLNNDRVRAALRGTINSFLKSMVDDEMLISYDLSVTATRDEQIRGVVQVVMTLQPVFSINFIRVTMILS